MDGVDQFEGRWPEPYRIVQNAGTGVISQGTAEWRNYRVDAPISIYLAKAGGIAAGVQGLRRYYALLLCADGVARLVKALAGTHTLAEVPFQWSAFETHHLALEVAGSRVRGWIDGEAILVADDNDRPLTGGGVGLVVEEGCLGSGAVEIRPLPYQSP